MFPSFLDKSNLPHKSGVYMFLNSSGKIIYVGKAIDIYHRVSSYFNHSNVDSPKTVALVTQIAAYKTIVVESELEALLLEANLIKKYLPPFNIRLTDDKDYLYVKVTKESFPKVLPARKAELGNAWQYFGPFPSGTTVRQTLKKLRRIFPWCASPPKAFANSQKIYLKPCFYYHLGLCPGPCAGALNQKQYRKNINRFIKFMRGKSGELKTSLEKEMTRYADLKQFEQAQIVKKTLFGLNYLTQSNNLQNYLANPNFLEDVRQKSLQSLSYDLGLAKLPGRIECFDISNLMGKQAVGSMVVLTDGEVDKSAYRKFRIFLPGKPNDFAMMAEVVGRRLKHKEWPYPDLMLIDGGIGQARAAHTELLKAGLSFPIFGLAKRMEWLYTPENKIIKLPKSSLSIRMLTKVRDEAHRFAITYHKKLRNQMFNTL